MGEDGLLPKGFRGKFSSPGYPFVQIVSLALSAIMLITLGTQSLMVGTATLVVGLAVHLIRNEYARTDPKPGNFGVSA